MKLKLLGLLLLVGSQPLPALSPDAPASQPAFTYSGPENSLQIFAHWEAHQISNHTVRVLGSDSKPGSEWQTGAYVRSIIDARIYDGKVAIIYEDHGGAQKVGVWEAESGKQIENIICYQPGFSNTGRYVTYMLFYPRNASVHELLAIYDLGSNQQQNRPGSPELEKLPEIQEISGYVESHREVGIPISPLSDRAIEDGYEYQRAPALEAKTFVTSPVWAADDKAFAFLAATGHGVESAPIQTNLIIMLVEPGSLDSWRKKKVDLDLVIKDRALAGAMDLRPASVRILPQGIVRIHSEAPRAVLVFEVPFSGTGSE